jgi:hypothetical protein
MAAPDCRKAGDLDRFCLTVTSSFCCPMAADCEARSLPILLARNINQRQELAIGLTGSEKPNVRYWHKADMLNALANVRFCGQGGQ